MASRRYGVLNGCPVDIRLAPTGVERRSEIPIKLQVVSNLEQVIVLRCETCSKREYLPLIMCWRYKKDR